MQIQSRLNNQPAFKMALRVPNLKGMTAQEVAAIRKALPQLDEIADTVDIKISKGVKTVRLANGYNSEPIDYPCFDLEFFKPGNFLTRMFKKNADFLQKSESFDNPHLKDLDQILIKAAKDGKEGYIKANGIDLENEAKLLKEEMESKKVGFPDYKNPPAPPKAKYKP